MAVTYQIQTITTKCWILCLLVCWRCLYFQPIFITTDTENLPNFPPQNVLCSKKSQNLPIIIDTLTKDIDISEKPVKSNQLKCNQFNSVIWTGLVFEVIEVNGGHFVKERKFEAEKIQINVKKKIKFQTLFLCYMAIFLLKMGQKIRKFQQG